MHISIKLTDRDLLNINNVAVNELICALKTISVHTAQGEEAPVASQKALPEEKGKAKAKTKNATETANAPSDAVQAEKPVEHAKNETKPEPIEAEKPIEEEKEKEEPVAEDKVIDYTALRDELRKELASIARAGKSGGLKKLLEEHGVVKFSELPDEQLEDFRTAAKAL